MLRRSRGGGSTILVGHRQSRSQGRVALLDPYGTDQTAPRQLFLILSKAVRTFPWARAACISANKDTLFRIHGTNQPSTIGTLVSSGCIRLTNEDVMDLYRRVQVGTRVVVLPGQPRASTSFAPLPAMPPRNASVQPTPPPFAMAR